MAQYFIRTALEQMARYRAQSLLVVIGVAIGVANIILLMSMTDMGRRQTLGLLEDFGARVLIFTPYFDATAGGMSLFTQANTSGHLPLEVYEALRRSPHISKKAGSGAPEVSALLLLSGHVAGPEQSWYTTVAGATAEVIQFAGFELAEGRWITADDESVKSQVAVLGEKARIELFGDAAALGEQVTIRGEDFTVVGTLKHKPAVGMEENDNRVFIPLSRAQELFEFGGVHGILARYRQGLDEDEALKLIKRELQSASPEDEPLDEVVSIFTVHEATKLMDSTLSIFRTVLLGVASIALIVAGIGIMNVMLIRVLRRRAEIGVRRAVGAQLNSIVTQFVIESAVQAMIGALLGLLVGAAGLYVFTKYSDWEFYISLRTLLIALGFGTLVGVAFGAYPAWTAAKVDPIKSLRHEQ